MVKAPSFWYKSCLLTPLLAPLGWGYNIMTRLRRCFTLPYKSPIPVICVGNLVLGGSGKTPTVIALVEIFKHRGYNPHILSRGYKGNVEKNTLVDPEIHTFKEVGDEPLLLAKHAPTWVGKNRIQSAKLALQRGADLLIMDDGLQNPTLHHDLKLVVIDGVQGLGNGYVFPAGPLRENPVKGLERADGVIMINGHVDLVTPKPTFMAQTLVKNHLSCQRVVGFAGLGFPEKFRLTLINQGYEVCNFQEFPDHHAYGEKDMEKLVRLAQDHDAHLVTTAKDMLRVPSNWHSHVLTLEIELKFDSLLTFLEFLDQKFM